MAPFAGKPEPFFTATAPSHDFPSLSGDRSVDVAVVGGGLVGLTAAYLLQQAGRTVAVVEALKIGGQATGRSTAKITSQHHLIYSTLVKGYGEDGARTYAQAQEAAKERMWSIAHELDIQCDMERKAAYVVAVSPDHMSKIQHEVEIAQRLGLPASFTRETSLPFAIAGAIRFDNQAQFHPSKYLIGLAQRIAERGGAIYERTRVTSIEPGERTGTVQTDAGRILAKDVIVATHMPIVMAGKFFAKAYPYAHPMVAGPMDADRAPDGMFITVDQPTWSFRTARHDGKLFGVAVGGTYRTGHAADAEKSANALLDVLGQRFGLRDIAYHWTNEDFMSMDGIPFVGRAAKDEAHLFVAVGFNAWGMTNGTAAAMILADTILGKLSPWAALFDSTRVKALQGGVSFLTENTKVAAHLAGGYLRRDRKSPETLAPSQAAVFDMDGERVAAYRDVEGRLHTVSATCTHMGCILGWNPIDLTWDCPCHGSRFSATGEVINGPAVSPLSEAPQREQEPQQRHRR